MAKLTEIEGIGESYAQKLQKASVGTPDQLLEKGAAPTGRQEIAEKAGVSEKITLRWVNMADLFRIKGVGGEYADLLEAAGVDTVPELAQRNAENLHKKLAEVNEAKKLVRRVPTQSDVSGWIDLAKKLTRALIGQALKLMKIFLSSAGKHCGCFRCHTVSQSGSADFSHTRSEFGWSPPAQCLVGRDKE
jgi:predicted flap endonuclease-1-like 5' DNA nuclease